MVIDMRENGNHARSMVRARIYSLMVVAMLASTLMDYLMAQESTIGLMEAITKVVSSKALSMEKEPCLRNPCKINQNGSFMRVVLKEIREKDMEK